MSTVKSLSFSEHQTGMKRIHASIPRLVLVLAGVLLIAGISQAQPAKGANKFLGNITTNGAVRSDFMTYWNQITPENESKWQSVESTRGTFVWTGVDNVKNFATQNNILWKFHTLVWGSQYPTWITSLSTADQLTEVTEWMDAAKTKYPDLPMIDVVNEAYPSHAPAPYKAALGGDGTTGYDWIFKAFTMARTRWPNAILIYNDYNNCEYSGEVNWTVDLITKAKANNIPIDAIGCQAHDAYKLTTATVKSNIDKLAATGLPIFITEYDIGQTDDATQLSIMKEQFTMFWTHSKIVGVTYWGYVTGSTWRTGTGLMSSSGTERPALTWLKDYVKNNPNPANDFPGLLKLGTVGTLSPNAATRQATAVRNDRKHVEVFDLQGRTAKPFYVNSQTIPVSSMVSSQGNYVVKQDGTCAEIINVTK